MSKKEADKAPALGWFDTTPVELDPPAEDPAIAVLNRIAEFEDTLPDFVHEWQKGDAAPDWMGPRPAWAEDYYDRADRFRPSECFWQSEEIELPVLDLCGEKTVNGSARVMGRYRVFLRQQVNHREPRVIIRVGPKSNQQLLPLTFSEVEDLVAALEMLTDIAKMNIANGAGGD